MAYHSNSAATIDLADSWGHGRAPRRDWAHVPAVIVTDDGDGHHDAWRFTGRARDAAALIARVYMRSAMRDGRVAILDGMALAIAEAPDGFWRDVTDQDGEIMETVAQPADHLAVVAW